MSIVPIKAFSEKAKADPELKESLKASLRAALGRPVGFEGVKECGLVDSEGHAAALLALRNSASRSARPRSSSE